MFLNLFAVTFRIICLCLLLAIAATIPIVQWAALGYLLEASGRQAAGRPWKDILPGLKFAGRIGWLGIAIFVTWLPVWLVTQFAYQADLISPGSETASAWRVAAIVLGLSWIVHVVWATIRGGRWRDFIWPAPLRFFREFFRLSTWRRVEDELWLFVSHFQLLSLMWLGFRAWIGALLWLLVPGVLIVLGMQAGQPTARFVLGFLGIVSMWWVLLYLPFLQIQFAVDKRWSSMFRKSTIRASFRRAPWAFFLGLFTTLLLAIPLYLLRIESLPKELLWVACLVFVVMTLPAKLVVGWALHRASKALDQRWWLSRYAAWLFGIAIVPAYIVFLYLGTLASWDGPAIVFLQHAFLTPAPFFGR